MISMTGFGRHEIITSEFQAVVEIKSYNGRNLEIITNCIPALNGIQPYIRTYISKKVVRGKVEVYVKYINFMQEVVVTIDKKLARSYLIAFEQFSHEISDSKININQLLEINGIFREERTIDIVKIWKDISEVLDLAYQKFDESRRTEGELTAIDIEEQLRSVDIKMAYINEISPETIENMQSNLLKKISNLDENVEDKSLIVIAIAAILTKSDINEEIARLSGHLKVFREVQQTKKQGIGKKLEFLSQEIMREANTIASKASNYEISSAVIELKSSVERIREQLRNVE